MLLLARRCLLLALVAVNATTNNDDFLVRHCVYQVAWKKDENKDFLEKSFIAEWAQNLLFKALQNFKQFCPYTLIVSNELKEDYTLIKIPANYLDYDYLHGSEE